MTMPNKNWEEFVRNEGLGIDAAQADLSHLDMHMSAIKDPILAWTDNPQKTLYLYGPTGCGKTYAGLCILSSFAGWKRFLSAGRITEIGKAKGASYLQEIYGECPLLMIDDLGVDMPADWDQKYLYELIDFRCQKWKKPTIVTSNLSKVKLAPIVTDRVVSRLAGIEIKFSNRDLR